jgi:DNA-binding transcriptional LysR family regulator
MKKRKVIVLYDYLAEFVEVCRAGSMGRAALRLSISQPALSRHMFSLEQDLGVQLLVRSEHGCVPTALGEDVLSRATDIIETADSIRRVVLNSQVSATSTSYNARQLVISGDIALASIPSAVRNALKALGEDRVKVTFRGPKLTQEDTLEDLLIPGDDVLYQRVDAVLLFQADPRLEIDKSCIVTEPVWKEPFYVAVKPNHPLVMAKGVSMHELEEQVFVFPRGDFLNSYTGWDEFKRICNLHGFNPRSVSKPFNDEGDVYSWDIYNEACPVNRSTPISPAFFEGDFSCVPVLDECYPHLAMAYRAGDDFVARLARELRGINHAMLKGLHLHGDIEEI